MFTRFRLRTLLPFAAIGIAAMLAGCVYDDPYGYGYGYDYTAPASVNFAFWDDHHWRHDWDDHHWRRHWDDHRWRRHWDH